MRTMIVRPRADDAIEGWRCSRCSWSYDLEEPVAEGDLSSDDYQAARENFREHSCAEFP